MISEERVMVAHGTPAEGFTLIGPMITNSYAIEAVTDRLDSQDQYWWYMPITDPAEFMRAHLIEIDEDASREDERK